LGKLSGELSFEAHRGLSAEIEALARSDSDRRLFLSAKCNIGRSARGLAYTIESCMITGGAEAPTILWESDYVNDNADQALTAEKDDIRLTARADAEDFLRQALADGPRPVKEIKGEAEDAGLTMRTVRRAKDDIGVRSRRQSYGGGGEGEWVWYLPSSSGAQSCG
jgi:putative DNA primase/helicase